MTSRPPDDSPQSDPSPTPPQVGRPIDPPPPVEAGPQPAGRGCLPTAWKQLAALVIVAAVAAGLLGWCVLAQGDDDSGKSPGDGSPSPSASTSPGSSPSAPVASSPSVRPSVSPSASASASPAAASPSATTAGSTPGQATATKAPPTNTPPPGSTATPVTPTATATPVTPTSTPTPSPTPTTAFTNWTGNWHSSYECNSDGPQFRWSVSLTQDGAGYVSGSIIFHKCPGGGQAGYTVTGRATGASTIQLLGTKGPPQAGALGNGAPATQTFTFAKGGPPNPDYSYVP